MLQVRNVTHWFGDVRVLDQISFNLNRGDRAGLIGPNGSGKTTLLRILTGQLEPDRGRVLLAPATVRVGYLPQALHFPMQATVGKVLQSAKSELMAAETRLAQLAERISVASGAGRGQSEGSEMQALMVAYDQALAEFEALGGSRVRSALKAEADSVLAGLGMADVDQAQPVDSLSGGQKTRLGLARLLLAEPDLLLLDEPTNHLDISALAWLETYLAAYPGAVLVVSHDRTFLDQTVNCILALDEVTHTLREHAGNYTDYAMVMDTELEKQWAGYKEQQARMQRLAASIHKLSGQARGIEQETIHFHYRRIAKDLARRAVVQKRRLERMLEAEDLVEKPGMTWKMKLEFPDTPRSGQDVLHIEDLQAGYGDHSTGRPVLDKVNLHAQCGERVALIGSNGSGKTTLLRCIAGELAPWSGDIRLGRGVRLGYMAQEQETLDAATTPYRLIRDAAPLTETEARSFLHYFLFAGDEVFVPVGRLSFGERSRLALALLAARGCNLLLLDEPINHLDIPSREGFERAMARFQGTVIAVVHDRYFIERFATTIWSVEPRPDGLPVSTVEVLAA